MLFTELPWQHQRGDAWLGRKCLSARLCLSRAVTMAARQAIHVHCHLKFSQLEGEREGAKGGCVFVFVREGVMLLRKALTHMISCLQSTRV